MSNLPQMTRSAGMRNFFAQGSTLCIDQSGNAFISHASPVYDACTLSTMRSAPVLSVKNMKLWKMTIAVRWLVCPQGDSVVPTTSDFLPVKMWICRDLVVCDQREKKNVWMGGKECSRNRELLVQPLSANSSTLVFLKPALLHCLAFVPAPWVFTQTDKNGFTPFISFFSTYKTKSILLHSFTASQYYSHKWWPHGLYTNTLHAISRENWLKVNNIYYWICLR